MIKSASILALSVLASELDSAYFFNEADGLDVMAKNMLSDGPESALEKKIFNHILDAAHEFLEHNDIDADPLSLVEELAMSFYDTFERHFDENLSKDLDDGRFGLNDSTDPTGKAA